MAKKTEETTVEQKDIYTTQEGLIITIVPAKPNLIQKATRSVKVPRRPTYEVKTFGGKIEHYPMDAEAAMETEGGLARWQDYVEQRDDAMAEQNERSVMAIFLSGTRIDDEDTRNAIISDEWEMTYEFLGIDVPEKFELRKAFYLANELDADDLTGLINAIMRTMGVDEATINEAEESFRDSVHDESGGAGDVA